MRKCLFFCGLALLVAFSAQAEDLCGPTSLHKFKENLSKLLSGRGSACDLKKPEKLWELEWSDEFEGVGKPDPAKWKYETGGDGWGNDEDQYYTDKVDNAYQKDGKLVIEAKKEDYKNRKFTSARLNSQFAFTYGRVEMRAKLPSQRGTWAAGWMLPHQHKYSDGNAKPWAKTFSEQGWPDNGEIDIIEAVGHEGGINHVSTHTKDYNFQLQSQKTATESIPDADKEFHTYAMEWMPNQIVFYVDNKKIMTVEKEKDANWRKWPFDQDFHFVLNLAVGGFWARTNGIDEEALPAKFELDYIRVYRPTKENPGCKSREE